MFINVYFIICTELLLSGPWCLNLLVNNPSSFVVDEHPVNNMGNSVNYM